MRANIDSPASLVRTEAFVLCLSLCLSTYSGATGHGSQQAIIDFDDLLDCLACYPIPSCRSWVRAYYYTALESEGESGGTMGNLDGTVGVRVVIGHGS